MLKPIPSRNNLLIPDSIHLVADYPNDYEMIHVDRLQEPQFGLSTVKSMGSQERHETRDTKLLYSDRSQNNLTSRSNHHSTRRYDKPPKEEIVMINTDGILNESVEKKQSPFSKYMSEMQQRISVREQAFEDQHDC